MIPKVPGPPTLIDRVKRAGNFEGFGDAFNFQISNTEEQRQAGVSARVPIKWPLDEVRAPGKVRAQLTAMMDAAIAHAIALQGPRAFECPKSSAAIHEAGHAVFYAKSGVVPSKIAIWPIVISGEHRWIGRTYGVPPYRIDSATDAESNLNVAQELISGVAAECLFDRNYRIGSSLNEIVLAAAAVGAAALKMQYNAEMLWFETCNEVVAILKVNEEVVRQVAGELMQKGVCKGKRLKQLLHGGISKKSQ